MKFKVNFNDFVKVKLTEYGIEILKQKHEEDKKSISETASKEYIDTVFGDFKLKLDEEGYFKEQIWKLMYLFGEHMNVIYKNVFESDMIFLDGEPIE